MNTLLLLNLFIPFALGIVIGSCFLWIYYRVRTGEFQKKASAIIKKAEDKAKNIIQDADLACKIKGVEHQRKLDHMRQVEQEKLRHEEDRLNHREDKLEDRMNLVEKKLLDIEKKNSIIDGRKKQLSDEKRQIKIYKNNLILQLEKISNLSAKDAEKMLLEKVSNQVKKHAAHLTEKIIKEAKEESQKKATEIIATSINRLAISCVSDVIISTVSLPSDEMKGRIIGREGRNIRTLEQATGVNIIIDETPRIVVISGFDPIRKHIAKMSLRELVLDGRIHPTRIEEVVQNVTESVSKEIIKFGEEAAMNAGIVDLHPELIKLLGKLKFRYSFGQNILAHSIEVSYILSMMAAELGINQTLAKRIGLLHDIGKAVSHELHGSHAMIGHDLAQKYGESPDVVNGIGAHHEEIPPLTIEGELCSAADAISAARPGARIEAVDQYINRLKQLEALSCEYPGVAQAYAMQAGKEIRVVVRPDIIDDEGTINLSRELAKKIEANLTYPGKIKVTVIREKRVVEYAI